MAAAAAAEWQPVRLTPEFSPELESLLLSQYRSAFVSVFKGRNPALRRKVKKHLLALGWTISSSPGCGLRYISPVDGKPYYNLSHVMGTLHLQSAAAAAAAAGEDSSSRSGSSSSSSHQSDTQHADDPGADDDDAIAEYVALMEDSSRRRTQGKEVQELRTKAKEQLMSSGWTFPIKDKSDGRKELRYQAPHGRCYNSLLTACKAYHLHHHMPPAAASPPTTTAAGDASGPATPIVDNARTKKRRAPPSSAASGAGEGDAKKKRRKTKKRKARVDLRPRPKDDGDDPELPPRSSGRARTLLSVLMDRKILAPREKLSYKTKKGVITEDGMVRCGCGCKKKELTAAEFAVHGDGDGASPSERPWAHMFLRDGRSLSQCLVQLMAADDEEGSSRNRKKHKNGGGGVGVRVKRKWSSSEEEDYVCSMCQECGELLMCDCCPSMFHHGCVGLEGTPQGDWFCPACRCTICGSSDFFCGDDGDDDDTAGSRRRFNDRTVIYCHQCEREYHVGCVRDRGDDEPNIKGPWLCSQSCKKIFEQLQGMAGRWMPVISSSSVEGLSLIVLRSGAAAERGEDEEAQAAEHAKLCLALDVLHECFLTHTDHHTNADFCHDILFNRESELRRLNFRGFYTVGLEKAGELITVATFSVYGDKVAQVPLVGTRFAHRRQGLCHLLMNELDKLLGELGVERVVLPAVPELLASWTGSFGFIEMEQADRQELAHHSILCFQGTTMCHKFLNTHRHTAR